MKDIAGKPVKIPKFSHSIKDAYKAALGSIGFLKKTIVPNEYEKVIFFILDGLGYKVMNERGILKKTRMKTTEMGSVIPSVTPSALSSIFTGTDPATHGVVGVSFWMSQIGAGFSPLGFYNLSKGEVSDLDSSELLLSDSLVTSSIKEGVDTRVVLPDSIENGLSQALYEGSTANFVPSLGGTYYGLSKFLRNKSESIAIAYHEQPDMLLHEGYPDAAIKAELNAVFSVVKKLKSQKSAKKTVLIFMGDHGSIEMNGISELLSISDMLKTRPLGGSRHAHLYVKKGKKEEVVKNILGAHVFDSQRILDKKFLGKPNYETYNRMGDLFLLAKEDNALFYEKAPFSSDHGSITKEELSTAFLHCTLSDFNPLRL